MATASMTANAILSVMQEKLFGEYIDVTYQESTLMNVLTRGAFENYGIPTTGTKISDLMGMAVYRPEVGNGISFGVKLAQMGGNVAYSTDVSAGTLTQAHNAYAQRAITDFTTATAPIQINFSEMLKATGGKWNEELPSPELPIVAGQMEAVLRLYVHDAMTTLMDTLGTGLYGTNNTVGSGILGLRAALATGSTYLGISHSSYARWRGNIDATAYTQTNAYTNTSTNDVLRILDRTARTCELNGAKRRDLVFACDATFAELYTRAIGGGNTLYRAMVGNKDAEIEGTRYNGVRVLHDPKCPTSKAFMIDTKTTMLIPYGSTKPAMFPLTPNSASTTLEASLNWMLQLIAKFPQRNVWLDSVYAS